MNKTANNTMKNYKYVNLKQMLKNARPLTDLTEDNPIYNAHIVNDCIFIFHKDGTWSGKNIGSYDRFDRDLARFDGVLPHNFNTTGMDLLYKILNYDIIRNKKEVESILKDIEDHNKDWQKREDMKQLTRLADKYDIQLSVKRK